MQTFFLAVQEKGYFVLNDLFRYLPEAPQSAPEPETHTAPPSFAPIENGYSQPAAPSHVPYPPQVRFSDNLLLCYTNYRQGQLYLACKTCINISSSSCTKQHCPLPVCGDVAWRRGCTHPLCDDASEIQPTR